MKKFFIVFTNIVIFLPHMAFCQKALWSESFDTVAPPHLPEGWESSRSGSASTSDASTTPSVPHSAPGVLLFTNAKKNQWIMSPMCTSLPGSSIRLEFVDRRSTTFTSDIIVEISKDDSGTFIQIGDTLRGNTYNSYVKHSVDIALSEETPEIRIRWRIIGNSGGSTATYRIDDIILYSTEVVDMGVRWLALTPEFPKRDEPVIVKGCVMNCGTMPARDIRMRLMHNVCSDSIFTGNEVVMEKTVPVLAASDSSFIEYVMSVPEAQRHRFVLTVSVAEDANLSNDTLRLDFFVSPRKNSIVINEIMPAPHPAEPEWIELYLNGKDTMSFEGYSIENHRKKIPITAWNSLGKIPVPGFIVLTRDTTSLGKFYDIPERTMIQIPLQEYFLNNDEGDVVLRDANDRPLDSLHYVSSWGNGPGTSLERIDANSPSDSSNWSGSQHPKGGTPGRRNSVSQKEHDVVIKNFFSQDAKIPSGMGILFHATLVNRGVEDVDDIAISLYHDTHRDSLLSPDERIVSLHEIALAAGTEREIHIGPIQAISGLHLYALAVTCCWKEDTVRQIAWVTVNTGYPRSSLLINEIMFAPAEGEAEYIELWNTADEDITLSGWKISDATAPPGTRNHAVILPSGYIIHRKEYFVIASDSSIFKRFFLSSAGVFIAGRSALSLNNEGDDVRLDDPSGSLIDSVRYSAAWHHPDRSMTTGIALERISPYQSSNDPANWTSSTAAEGGTPGRQNSVYLASEPQALTILISPNPFSPDGDGVDDLVTVSAQFPSRTVLVRARIFDSMGHLIKTLSQEAFTGSSYNVQWDGMNNNNQKCRMGLYILYIEAIDGMGGKHYSLKRPLVLAGRL